MADHSSEDLWTLTPPMMTVSSSLEICGCCSVPRESISWKPISKDSIEHSISIPIGCNSELNVMFDTNIASNKICNEITE